MAKESKEAPESLAYCTWMARGNLAILKCDSCSVWGTPLLFSMALICICGNKKFHFLVFILIEMIKDLKFACVPFCKETLPFWGVLVKVALLMGFCNTLVNWAGSTYSSNFLFVNFQYASKRGGKKCLIYCFPLR